MRKTVDELRSIRILKARNGIALIAVLAILLVVTLLVPVMFSMSESATRESVKGTDKQRASYLARSMCEMSVGAFEKWHEEAQKAEKEGNTTSTVYKKYRDFTKNTKAMSASTLYWYKSDIAPAGDAADSYDADTQTYYSLSAAETAGELIGHANCDVTFIDNVEYYLITGGGEPVPMFVSYKDASGHWIGCPDNRDYSTYTEEMKDAEFKSLQEAAVNQIKNSGSQGATEYMKVTNRRIHFESQAQIENKPNIVERRICDIILPTKPDEQNWIAPAKLGSYQVFPDTSQASGIIPIDYSGSGIEGDYVQQPLYVFSCLGNMIISFDKIPGLNSDGTVDTSLTYFDQYPSIKPKLSLGLRPEVTPLDEENDYNFSTLRAVNMASWYGDAQMDNFVAYTATNAIEVDVPVSLLVNPCRTDRLGDGVNISILADKNRSLYKVMIFHAPNIVFKGPVTTFISFYTPPPSKNDQARRMSTVILNAPDNTPYSYVNEDRERTVKAGKVSFEQGAKVRVIPYGENGSAYSEHWYEFNQTIYKPEDFIEYPLVKPGSVCYFNADIEMELKNEQSSSDIVNKWNTYFGKNGSGKMVKTGFSLTSYFVDVYYRNDIKAFKASSMTVWNHMKEQLFNRYMTSDSYEATYYPDDLKIIGNANTDPEVVAPEVNEYYTIWDS